MLRTVLPAIAITIAASALPALAQGSSDPVVQTATETRQVVQSSRVASVASVAPYANPLALGSGDAAQREEARSAWGRCVIAAAPADAIAFVLGSPAQVRAARRALLPVNRACERTDGRGVGFLYLSTRRALILNALAEAQGARGVP